MSNDANQQLRDVSIVLPCYNESENIEELYSRIARVADTEKKYRFAFLFVDNASSDNTVERIRGLAKADDRISCIVNARNFGHIRSPYYGLLQATGDCVLMMATDLQDPPELISEFLAIWERGSAVVVGMKTSSEESKLFYTLRTIFYGTVRRISEIEMLEHVTGFGLYDRSAIEVFREMKDPYPYLRGMITEIGLPFTLVPYHQAVRKRGITKNNFLTLIDIALLAVTSYSKIPLRLSILTGFISSITSLLVALVFLVLKFLYWDFFPAGYAPAVIGVFFLGSINIFILGIVGEYVGAILTHVRNRPLVVEKERFGGHCK